jgi:hypothetical protein
MAASALGLDAIVTTSPLRRDFCSPARLPTDREIEERAFGDSGRTAEGSGAASGMLETRSLRQRAGPTSPRETVRSVGLLGKQETRHFLDEIEIPCYTSFYSRNPAFARLGGSPGKRRGCPAENFFIWIRCNPLKSPDSAKGFQGNPSLFSWFSLDSFGFIWFCLAA